MFAAFVKPTKEVCGVSVSMCTVFRMCFVNHTVLGVFFVSLREMSVALHITVRIVYLLM